MIYSHIIAYAGGLAYVRRELQGQTAKETDQRGETRISLAVVSLGCWHERSLLA